MLPSRTYIWPQGSRNSSAALSGRRRCNGDVTPSSGQDENGSLQPVAELEFEDGELQLSWITENGAYAETTIPRE